MKALRNLWAKARREGPSKAIAAFLATSLAARAVGISCQLLQVPIMVKALGVEAFGLWMTLTSITNLMTFADLGVGLGVQNRIAESLATGEREEARDLFGSAFGLLSLIGLVLGVVLVIGVGQIDLAAWLHLEAPATIADAPLAMQAFLAVFSLGFPFSLAQRLALARQEGWMFNATQALGNVIGLVVIAVGARLEAGLAVMVAGAVGSIVAGNFCLLIVQLARSGWLRLRGWHWQPQLVGGLLRLGALFGVQQLMAVILFSVPQLIISTTLGAAAVTPYNLVQRIFNLFAVVQNGFMIPLWPAYSQARAKGEFSWIRRTLRKSVWLTLGCSVLPLILGAFFARDIIRLWVGAEAPMPSGTLVALLALWNALVFLQQPFGFMLAGVSEVKRVTVHCVTSGICSFVLMTWWVHDFGQVGVVAGLIVGFVPFRFFGSIIESWRYLQVNQPAPATS